MRSSHPSYGYQMNQKICFTLQNSMDNSGRCFNANCVMSGKWHNLLCCKDLVYLSHFALHTLFCVITSQQGWIWKHSIFQNNRTDTIIRETRNHDQTLRALIFWEQFSKPGKKTTFLQAIVLCKEYSSARLWHQYQCIGAWPLNHEDDVAELSLIPIINLFCSSLTD